MTLISHSEKKKFLLPKSQHEEWRLEYEACFGVSKEDINIAKDETADNNISQRQIEVDFDFQKK